MSRGCSGTTSLGGKWLFFISFPSLRVQLSVDWRLGGSFDEPADCCTVYSFLVNAEVL